jgi:hypothetical protein
LPPENSVSDLPVLPSCCQGQRVEISTDCELEVLSRLTSWALVQKVQLVGLSVTRPTLEDVYLGLTRESLASSDAVHS